MSGPVDVLAVLDVFCARASNEPLSDVVQARAAVAELIEAAHRARGILALHDDRCPKLDAALANVGSAP